MFEHPNTPEYNGYTDSFIILVQFSPNIYLKATNNDNDKKSKIKGKKYTLDYFELHLVCLENHPFDKQINIFIHLFWFRFLINLFRSYQS